MERIIQVNNIIKNIILFILGYCFYIAIEITYRGTSYILMGLIGAIAFVLIDKINDYISWDLDLLLQGCMGSALITFFELIVGEFALSNPELLPRMWNYSNMPFNFDGVICLPF